MKGTPLGICLNHSTNKQVTRLEKGPCLKLENSNIGLESESLLPDVNEIKSQMNIC